MTIFHFSFVAVAFFAIYIQTKNNALIVILILYHAIMLTSIDVAWSANPAL